MDTEKMDSRRSNAGHEIQYYWDEDKWDARSGGMQDRKDIGYDRRNAGQKECRTGGMQDREDAVE